MAMSKTNDAAVKTLNDLIDVCLDGAEGYQTAMKDATSTGLKNLLQQFSSQRSQFARELQSEVTRLGGDAERSGTARGALHRGLMNIKSAVGTNNDLAILEECERGEDVAKDTYEKALRGETKDVAALPADTRQLLKRQYDQIVSSHDSMKILRDREKRA